MDWVAASDLSDSSFSVEQARKEFEKIINSLDDADPQLIALVKERLKVCAKKAHDYAAGSFAKNSSNVLLFAITYQMQHFLIL